MVVVAEEKMNKIELNLKFDKKPISNEEDSLDNNNITNDNNDQEIIEDEIGSILRESYMHPLYR